MHLASENISKIQATISCPSKTPIHGTFWLKIGKILTEMMLEFGTLSKIEPHQTFEHISEYGGCISQLIIAAELKYQIRFNSAI
jgi:hypothetical protein